MSHCNGDNTQFKANLYTVCAYSKCEPQGGENANAELDV